MTVTDAVEAAVVALRAAGIETARLDAELLLRHVLGWERADLVTRGGEAFPGPAAELFREAVEQRSLRRPLQHLTGVQAFWRHEFLVTPDVLIPRQETELLVETALELLRDVRAPLIVDVGTGSGCIALSLAAERPDAEVHAVDLSEAALGVARGNAVRLRMAGRVAFHDGDLLEPVRHLEGRVDLVVSNPPYVTLGEWERLQPEVRDHEPVSSLVAPDQPYGIYRRLAQQARPLLRPGGHLLAELGEGMAEAVTRIFDEQGLRPASSLPDLAGIPRVAHARRG